MMNSVKKEKADKTIVREHVVQAAAKAFTRKGVKTVRMDDIAADLSISKRTLYELFHDKEDLLLDVMRLHREEMKKSMEEIASKAENVLEVILRFIRRAYRISRIQIGSSLRIWKSILELWLILPKAVKKTWMPQWSFIKRGSIKEYFAKM